MDSGVSKGPQSADFRRLREIEQRIQKCLEIAASAVAELAKVSDADRMSVVAACEEFVQNVQAAQKLVQDAVANAVGERNFEANVYRELMKSTIAMQKVETIQSYLGTMQHTLSTAGCWTEVASELHSSSASPEQKLES